VERGRGTGRESLKHKARAESRILTAREMFREENCLSEGDVPGSDVVDFPQGQETTKEKELKGGISFPTGVKVMGERCNGELS